jgi:hypothetical protein
MEQLAGGVGYGSDAKPQYADTRLAASSPISEGVDRLNGAIDEAQKMVEVLSQKLAYALCPSAPQTEACGAACKEARPGSPIAEGLSLMRGRVNGLTERLQGLISRLET